MRRNLPIAIVIVSGVFVTFQYYIPHPWGEFAFNFSLDWLQVIGVLAVGLGLVSLTKVNIIKVQRKAENWPYALVTLVSLATMLILGAFRGALEAGSPFMFLFTNALVPVYATMFSLLAFYIASAAYRAFRARSVLAATILLSAVIVMLGRVPIGRAMSPKLPAISDFIMTVPNMSAYRAILIGIGLGALSMAIKIVLGIEKTYMGRD